MFSPETITSLDGGDGKLNRERQRKLCKCTVLQLTSFSLTGKMWDKFAGEFQRGREMVSRRRCDKL